MNKKNKIFLYPMLFLWLIVLLPKTMQLGLYLLFIIVCISQYKIKLKYDLFMSLQLFNFAVFGLSIIISFLVGNHESTRVMAAINTLLINVSALILYGIYKEKSIGMNYEDIGKIYNIHAIFLSLLFILYRLGFSFPIINGRSISGSDWLENVYKPRFLGYMDYGNAVVLFILLIYPFIILHVKKFRNQAIVSILMWVTVIGTNSRTGLMLFTVLVVISLITGKNDEQFKRLSRNRAVIGLFAIIGAVIVGLLFSSQIQNEFEGLINARSDSNGMRSFIYRESINVTLKESPIIGKGIKDLIAPYNYPYGSHSTYIGQIYKSGILGSALYFISILVLLRNIIKRKSINRFELILKSTILCILVYMVFEDIDGTNWGICMFYISLALLFKSENMQGELHD